MYDIGDLIVHEATFRDAEGDPTDPTTVTFRLRSPDGTETVVEQASLTNPSEGVWSYEHVVTGPRGVWFTRWEGTGVVQQAEEATFRVRGSNFTLV
jgi:uncharacterized protein YfaS (alpha-2-macroglobulin family)